MEGFRGILPYLLLSHLCAFIRLGSGGCRFIYLDDDAAEKCYQLNAPEGITAEKIFDARRVTLIEAALFAAPPRVSSTRQQTSIRCAAALAR